VEAVRPAPGDEALFRTEPGLSSFAEHPQGAGPSLSGLLELAKAYVPAGERADASLWVKATAGMRRVPHAKADLIFRHLEGYLRQSEHCPFRLASTSILGGEEEAVFAYLGINTLLAEEQPAPAPTLASAQNPVGVLDMGGASMQVAYKPDTDILDGEFHFYEGEERQSIYARSFIQFGMETALDRAIAMLVRSADRQASSVDFPCFNRGFSEIMHIEGRRLRVQGTGESERCSELTQRLLHAEYECLLPPCPFMGVHVPQITELQRFYALSNFFYVPNGLGLVGWDEEKVVQPAEIAAATAKFCSRDIDSIMETAEQPLKYARHFCFGGHYIWNVLKALGFSDNSSSITCLRNLGRHAADWTYGAVLYETLDMPRHRPIAPPEDAAGAATAPCKAPPALRPADPVSQEEALRIARPPSILGVPNWWLWVGGLCAASMLGWFMHLVPYRCCDLKLSEAPFEVPNMPMSPVSFLAPDSARGQPPGLFRAVSAPMLQTYLPMGRPRRSSERKVTWASTLNP